jgi:hypothetical protein
MSIGVCLCDVAQASAGGRKLDPLTALCLQERPAVASSAVLERFPPPVDQSDEHGAEDRDARRIHVELAQKRTDLLNDDEWRERLTRLQMNETGNQRLAQRRQ